MVADSKLIKSLQTNDISEIKRISKKENFKDMINELSNIYLTPIWYMKKDNIGFVEEMFNVLVDNGAYLEHSNDYGQTLLMYCIERGYTSMAFSLIKADCYLDVRDIAGMSALHYAAYNLDLDTIKVLVGCEAQVDIEDNEGYTPLDYLLIGLKHQFVDTRKRKECIKLLEENEDTE